LSQAVCSEHYTQPSRFLGEVPPELIDEGPRPGPWSRAGVARRERSAGYGARGSVNAMRLGSRVRHAKFGEGVVLRIEGQVASTPGCRSTSRAAGAKWLVLGVRQSREGLGRVGGHWPVDYH